MRWLMCFLCLAPVVSMWFLCLLLLLLLLQSSSSCCNACILFVVLWYCSTGYTFTISLLICSVPFTKVSPNKAQTLAAHRASSKARLNSKAFNILATLLFSWLMLVPNEIDFDWVLSSFVGIIVASYHSSLIVEAVRRHLISACCTCTLARQLLVSLCCGQFTSSTQLIARVTGANQGGREGGNRARAKRGERALPVSCACHAGYSFENTKHSFSPLKRGNTTVSLATISLYQTYFRTALHLDKLTKTIKWQLSRTTLNAFYYLPLWIFLS